MNLLGKEMFFSSGENCVKNSVEVFCMYFYLSECKLKYVIIR